MNGGVLGSVGKEFSSRSCHQLGGVFSLEPDSETYAGVKVCTLLHDAKVAVVQLGKVGGERKGKKGEWGTLVSLQQGTEQGAASAALCLVAWFRGEAQL